MTKQTHDTGKPGFDEWLNNKLRAILTRHNAPVSPDALLRAVETALPQHLHSFKRHVNRGRVLQAFDEVFWAKHKRITKHLEKARCSVQQVKEMLLTELKQGEAMLPDWAIEWRLKEIYGWNDNAQPAPKILPGLHREDFLDTSPREFPETSFENPFPALPEHSSARVTVAWINAMKIGRAYNKNIHLNEVRSALSAARKQGCSAVVIGGGIFHQLLKQTSGYNRLKDDRSSGQHQNLDTLSPRHRRVWEEARRTRSLKPLWRTTSESTANLFGGLHKVANRPHLKDPTKVGPPEFTGMVYILLNEDDQEIIRKKVGAYLRYESIMAQSEAQSLKSVRAKQAADAKEALNAAMRSGVASRIRAAQAAYDRAEEAHEEACEDCIRYIVNNTDSEQNLAIEARAIASFANAIESVIPNSKVIGENVAYTRFGGNSDIYKIVSAGSNATAPWDVEVGTFHPEMLAEKQADVTMLMHPCVITPRMTPRERYRDGSMDVNPTMFVECPCIMDPAPIIERFRGMKATIPLVRAVRDKRYMPGMTIVEMYPDRPPDIRFLTLEAVRHFGAQKDSRVEVRDRPSDEYVDILLNSDSHIGGKMRIPIFLPSGHVMGITEAIHLLMRDYIAKNNGRAPVCGEWAADDSGHGNHLENQNRIHPQLELNSVITEVGNAWVERIKKITDPAEREIELIKHANWLAFQLRLRQPDHEGSQLEEWCQGIIEPNRFVFKGMLLRAHDSGLRIKTLSDFTGKKDERDLGYIAFATGNHMTNGLKNRVYEGAILRNQLRAHLLDDPDLKRLGIDVKRAITAPREQTRTTGYGIVKVGENGFPYGIHMLNAPPARNSWNDPMQAWIRNHLRRGNPSLIHNASNCGFIIYITGDKHFLVVELATGAMWVMCPPDTHTDEYANIAGDLPENNAGVAILRLAVKGPYKGQPYVVFITPRMIQEALTSGRGLDWNGLLHNAVPIVRR